MADRLTDLTLQLHHETRRGEEDSGAILVSYDGELDHAVWLPKAAVEWTRVSGKPNIIEAPLPERLAMDKGLI